MTATLESPETRDAPETAFSLPMGRVQFAAGTDADGKEARVKLVARSGEVIEHWYWGRIVHDLAGVRFAGEKVAFDWCHYAGDGSLGYGDKFDITTGNLVIEGLLVAFKADDRAAEIMHKGRKGVPYEASIYFDPLNGLRLEHLPEKMSATVNGRQVDGPCVIVRTCLVRGVAICLYGADPNSSTEFSRKADKQIKVTLFSAENPMSPSTDINKPAVIKTDEPTQLAAPAAAPAATVPAEAASTPDAAAQLRAQLNNFVTKFGAENGAKWFGESKTFAEACELHIAAQAEQLTNKNKEVAELKTKRAAVNTGETDPVAFGSAEAKDAPGATTPAATKFAHLGSGLSRFAAGIKLPGAK